MSRQPNCQVTLGKVSLMEPCSFHLKRRDSNLGPAKYVDPDGWEDACKDVKTGKFARLFAYCVHIIRSISDRACHDCRPR